eukprot:919512-Amphidinium_carterae.1
MQAGPRLKRIQISVANITWRETNKTDCGVHTQHILASFHFMPVPLRVSTGNDASRTSCSTARHL